VLHQAAFPVSLVVGTLLIVGADGTRRHAAAAVFAGSVAVCFGVSALYHRVAWTPRLRLWMRRIDHAGVYLLIAGTYTPVCPLVLNGAWRLVVLVMVWVGAGAAVVLRFAWVEAPRWVAAVLAMALGWAAVAVLPQLATRMQGVLGVIGRLVFGVERLHRTKHWRAMRVDQFPVEPTVGALEDRGRDLAFVRDPESACFEAGLAGKADAVLGELLGLVLRVLVYLGDVCGDWCGAAESRVIPERRPRSACPYALTR